MQAPGGPNEDTSGNFKFGGWTAPYFDEDAARIMERQMKPADLLLGRKTFDIFESYWPSHESNWPGINDMTKYVLSKTRKTSEWENSIFLEKLSDIVNLKSSNGTDILVHGSSQLVQLLLKNDLVDELWLKLFPVTLGSGKKLFGAGTKPSAFKLESSEVTSRGVIFANYKRAGKVETGYLG